MKVLAERSIDAETESAILVEADGLRAIDARFGIDALARAIEWRREQPNRGAIYIALGEDGEVVAGNVSGWSGRIDEGRDWISFEVTTPGDEPLPARARVTRLQSGGQLIVGRTLIAQEVFGDALNRSLGVAFAGAVLIGLAGGLLLARQNERRVEAMSRAIDDVRAGSLEVRLPVRAGGSDEFDRLSERINKLLAESEALIRGMRQVTDDVAHDLRTPLQRLHTRLEEALADAEGGVRDSLEAGLEDLDRLLRLFRTVLLITNTESGAPKQSFQPVDLSSIVDDAAELYEAVFEEREIAFTHHVQANERLTGNPALLAQAVANLLDNAAKYTPPGGRVALHLSGGPLACVEVRDNGAGIPRERHDEVLRRFTRLDSARDTPGHGLGLALVAAVAKLHGGTLRLDDAAPGLIVRLFLARTPLDS